MINVELPNELLLIAASAIADSRCGKMRFSMLDTAEWQVLIELDPIVGDMADDVYFIVRSQSNLPLSYIVANKYAYNPDLVEKLFTCLGDSVGDAIAHFNEISEAAA